VVLLHGLEAAIWHMRTDQLAAQQAFAAGSGRCHHEPLRLKRERYTDRANHSLRAFATLGFNDALGVFEVSVGTGWTPSNTELFAPRRYRLRRARSCEWRRAGLGRSWQRGNVGLNRGHGSGARHGRFGQFGKPLRSRAFGQCGGSFDGPYNIRLHLTAPRDSFHSARGERV
jgi:hypothetical protein